MNILWHSQYRPLPAQEEELQRLFGPCEIHPSAVNCDVNQILARFLTLEEPRELVLVAPLSVCREVIKRGIKPLSPRTITLDRAHVLYPETEWLHKGRVIRFSRFDRRTAVSETFAPVFAWDSAEQAELQTTEQGRQR